MTCSIPKKRMSKLARMGIGLLMIIEGVTLILTLGWWRPDLVLPYIRWDVRRRFRKSPEFKKSEILLLNQTNNKIAK